MGVPDGRYFSHPDQGEITVYRPIERCSILRTRERGTLLLTEEKDPYDNRALVLADIAAGFRGKTKWTGVKQEEFPCPDRGGELVYAWEGSCIECGVDYIPVANGYTHPNAGTIINWEQFPTSGITILTQGYKAQGETGNMGGHAVMLLLMEQGAAFRVERIGRLYGEPAERYVLWTGKELLLGTNDEVWPPYYENEEGDVI